MAEAIGVIRRHVRTAAPRVARMRRDAILYNLLILGEAVKALTEETKRRRPEIPWKQIAGLCDLLAHEYFQIDFDEIEKVIERDLGALDAAVSDLRAADSADEQKR
jgi:uncharacterized protein with HEPN domain